MPQAKKSKSIEQNLPPAAMYERKLMCFALHSCKQNFHSCKQNCTAHSSIVVSKTSTAHKKLSSFIAQR